MQHFPLLCTQLAAILAADIAGYREWRGRGNSTSGGGSDSMRIGFVGTGRMGTLIAGSLIRAGHVLSVFDCRQDATADLCTQGAERAETAFAAAYDSDVVFTSLPGPIEFEAAMLEPQTGILAGIRPGAAHIQCAEDHRPRGRGLPGTRN